MQPGTTVKRRLNAKSLPSAQATTVLALKSVRAEDDAKLVQLVCEIATWGMRPSFISLLIGNVATSLVVELCKKAQGLAVVGRAPTAIGELLAKPHTHLEASIFLRRFIAFLRMEGGTRQQLNEAFIQAYRDYRRSIIWMTRQPPRVSADYAYVLASFYVDGQALLSPCPDCKIHFVQSAEPIRVSYFHSRGGCPNCRAIESLKVSDKSPHKSPI